MTSEEMMGGRKSIKKKGGNSEMTSEEMMGGRKSIKKKEVTLK